MKRREFVQNAVAAAGMLSLPLFLEACKEKRGLGLQLYTLRDTIDKDPKGVLDKISVFGYTKLETNGYANGKIYGMDFQEFVKYAKGLGMKVTSGHYGLDKIKGDTWQQAVDDAKEAGQDFMVMPFIEEIDRISLDNYKKICDDLNKAGELCSKSGIRFGYHNHAFEFDKMDGEVVYDVMLQELDPKYVGMEMDIFWVVNAGLDPLQYFAKYPGRFEQWHVKDMDKDDRNRNADIGTGTIDFKPIFAQAKLSGMKEWYVEQETYPGDPIDSVAACAKFMKTIL
ncbi:MAG: sugar phosphate isomerase/epimerase [Cyclobacteriaceae bacterium]|nr:sugar phosphate isomerase/epimerase [Cyclobacteriaceae bacterium]MDH5249107.1 sugar phosphate isomerase/epimerase [Cyclobacteriaceae bacterium]